MISHQTACLLACTRPHCAGEVPMGAQHSLCSANWHRARQGDDASDALQQARLDTRANLDRRAIVTPARKFQSQQFQTLRIYRKNSRALERSWPPPAVCMVYDEDHDHCRRAVPEWAVSPASVARCSCHCPCLRRARFLGALASPRLHSALQRLTRRTRHSSDTYSSTLRDSRPLIASVVCAATSHARCPCEQVSARVKFCSILRSEADPHRSKRPGTPRTIPWARLAGCRAERQVHSPRQQLTHGTACLGAPRPGSSARPRP